MVQSSDPNFARARMLLPLAGCLHLRMDSWEAELERLHALTVSHLQAGGYRVLESVTKDGWRAERIEVPGRSDVVSLSVNGEVFALSFPGGYSWAEYAYEDEDRTEALMDLLRFLDAYASPATRELTVPRRLRADRRELRVSNGAVLRARGWSSGPPPS